MKYTLLEMVQRIMESMDSDEVNTISGTVESLAVANIIKECYFDIIGDLDLPEHQGIFQLDASGDSALPAYMTVPSNVVDIQTLQYNYNTTAAPSYQPVTFLPLDEFLLRINGLNTDDDNVGTMTVTSNGGTFVFKYRTDSHPHWYTTLDDNIILFDSYDSSVDSTLQSVKTFCFGNLNPEFTMEDDFVPRLDPRQFQLLLQEAKSQAFIEEKQVPNPKAEQKARRNRIITQKNKRAVDKRPEYLKYRSYGRK